MSGLSNDTYYNMGPKTFWFFFSKKSITGFVFLVIALILSMVRANFTSDPGTASFVRIFGWISFVIAISGFLVAFISSKLSYKNTGFTLSPDALLLRRGVFTKEEYAIPYRQIQNIEIERTLGDQMLGISKLIILTAGLETELESQDAPEGIVPAIDKDVAHSLQRELLKRANIQKVTTF